MSGLFLVAASFLATGVEMVEALTIILACGVTRGWRSALLGAGAATVVLAAAIAVFGTTLPDVISIDVLRVVVGAFLLVFGLQWLRKAILRYGGLKALHNEEAIFAAEVMALRHSPATVGALDWTSFVVSFKGVLLEGLEAAFIVITFGAAAREARLGGLQGVGLAAAAAGVALVMVVLAGVLLHQPLRRVPENTMKFAVGLLLTSFGTFWAGEGVGIAWPLDEGAILALLLFYGLASWAVIGTLRRGQAPARTAGQVAHP